MCLTWTQFKLLLWKNYLIEIRNPLHLLVELLMVILICYLIIVERNVEEVPHHPRVTFDFFKAADVDLKTDRSWLLLYTPEGNSDIDQMMNAIGRGKMSVKSFPSETHLLAFAKNISVRSRGIKVFAAVVFHNISKESAIYPSNFKFDIRFPYKFRHEINNRTRKDILNWKTDKVFAPLTWSGPLYMPEDLCGQPDYYEEGFLWLMESIMQRLLENFSRKYSKKKYRGSFSYRQPYMQRMPFPAHKDDETLINAKNYLAFYIIFSLILPVSYLIYDMTNEKTRGLDKLLKLCGVSIFLQHAAWFLKAFLNFIIIFLIYLFVLTKYSLWREDTFINLTNPFILFLFFSMYMFACITYCFLICACFTNAYSAYIVGGVVFVSTYLPYYVFSDEMSGYGKCTKIFLFLCPNTAFAYGMERIFLEESNGQGIQYSNAFGPMHSEFNLAIVSAILLADAVLFAILAFIIDSIIRFFQMRRCSNRNAVGSIYETATHNLKANPDHLIIVSVALISYPPILKNVTFNILKDEVTILLGRSGSGKTTLVNIIARLKRPLSGSISFKSNNETNRISLCPQKNIYYTDLTVWEHLHFFTNIRGHGKDAYDDVGMLLQSFQLDDYQNVKPRHLSRTSLRKMCMAIAFCGNTQLIILDQPFIGIDSISKRSISELICKRKKRCGILLTTNHIDQAHLLDGRIAILHAGEIKCSGSSDDLRQEYNLGHNLIVFKFNLCCKTDVVTDLIRNHIPKAELVDDFNLKLIYILPTNSVSVFPTLLKELEIQRKQCFIETFTIQICNIADVFNRVTNATAEHADESKDVRKYEAVIRSTCCLQLMAMHHKCMYRLGHNIFLFCMKILLPIAFLLLFLLLNTKYQEALPRLPLTIGSHFDPTVYFINDYPSYLAAIAHHFYNNYPFVYITQNDALHIAYEDYFIDIIEEDPIKTAKTLLFGIMFGTDHVLFFNHLHYHTPGVVLALYINIIAEKLNLTEIINIEVSNYPLPHSASAIDDLIKTEAKSGYNLSKGILYGLAVLTILFLIPHVNEKRFKFKHLQRASGVKFWIFWGYSFIHDFIIYLIVVACSLLVILIFHNLSLIGYLSVIYIAFGVAMVPMISFLSLICCRIYGILFAFAFLTGHYRFLFVDDTIELRGRYFFNALLLIFSPFYNVAAAVNNLYGEHDRMRRCTEFLDVCIGDDELLTPSCWDTLCNITIACCKQEGVYLQLDDPGYLPYVFNLILFGLVCTLLLMLYETRLIQRSFSSCGTNQGESKILIYHPAVQQEIAHVRALNKEDLGYFPITLTDLRKVFWRNNVAVDTVCLAVGQSECFAMLGTNGAGKTTIFKMITKDFYKSGGHIYILTNSINGNFEWIRKQIGYCPQNDAVLRDMTFKQTLLVFLMLRGYNSKLCHTKCEELANRFGMATKLDIQVKHLSRGERRVLNCCIAILGNSPVILLDEPTSGMDAIMRRTLWYNLYRLRLNGSSILFSCTSIIDCIAISSRFAHMSEGNFLWLGSPRSLKEEFENRFELAIKLVKVPFSPHYSITDMQDQQRNVVIDYVHYHFQGAILQESANEFIVFHIIKEPRLLWSTIFSIMETGKSDLHIQEYFIGEAYQSDLTERFRLL